MTIYSLLVWFLASLGLSLVLTARIRDLAMAKGIVTAPELDRHVHKEPVPRLGGIAIYVSVVAVLVLGVVGMRLFGIEEPFSLRDVGALLGPAAIIFALGLYDDLHGANAYVKFGFQAIAAVLLYFTEHGVDHLALFSKTFSFGVALGLPITVFWVLLVTNAFNLIDGLDGLSAGSALFSTAIVFVTALIIPNRPVAFVAIAMAGAILGFLRFNFPPATIFLGDSGSLFIGFMLSALALVGSEKAPTMVAVAIPVVALGLPISDVALAVVRRFLSAKPLFTGDARHIHHQLLKRGLCQRDAVLVLYAVTAGFGFLSLVLLEERRVLALVLAAAGIGVFLGLRQLRYHEFAELGSVMQRAARRRQVLANHVAIRHAAESLDECDEFESICQVLQQTFRPIGFSGIRLQILNQNGFSASSFHPLRYQPNGQLLFSWSEHAVHDSAWELRLELVTSSQIRWGFVTLFRARAREPLELDINVLMEDFRTSLSNAVDRACRKVEAVKHIEKVDHRTPTRDVATGIMAD